MLGLLGLLVVLLLSVVLVAGRAEVLMVIVMWNFIIACQLLLKLLSPMDAFCCG